MLLSKLDLYANVLAQLVNAQIYFTAHPEIYVSMESTNPQTPNLTIDYANPTYEEPATYYFGTSSTFYPLPYLDELLSKMLRNPNDQKYVKRINIFILNKQSANDLTARTLPADDQFTINSI